MYRLSSEELLFGGYMNNRVMMDSLESRVLMSGDGFGHEGHGLGLPPLPSNAGPNTTAAYNLAVTDRTTLMTDADTLRADRKISTPMSRPTIQRS
jgi:hypothetical protein